MVTFSHQSVMLEETINNLAIKPDGLYVDCTLGLGGHALAISEKLSKNGGLIGFDKDLEALAIARTKLLKKKNRFQCFQIDFSRINWKLQSLNIENVDGILVDLGLSNMQLQDYSRGFSYHVDAPLDMRMCKEQTYSAYQIINELSYNELVKIIFRNTEHPLSGKVAKAILENRPIKSTFELNEVLRKALPSALLRQKHPGKIFYQAFRMEVNNELDGLQEALPQFVKLLNKGGTLAIITFHSIEDRIVKKFFQQLTKPKFPHDFPVMETKHFVQKRFLPSQQEIEANPQARSAKLRILRKLI